MCIRDSFPIVDRKEGIYMKEYRRSFIKMDEEKDYVTTKKIINNKVFKANIPRRRMHPKKKENYKEQIDRIIEGYAQAIRELRKGRNQSMEKPNQKTDDDQPELEEIPEVKNNENQEDTGHVCTCLLYTSRCV